jgi:methanogenic corrinoid protein MtbC1
VSQDEKPSQPTPGVSGQLTIQEVSRLLDVPAPTIRSWERRYGVPEADRSSGGHRRYTHEQVQALRRMCEAVSRGQGPAKAATAAMTAEMRFSQAKPLVEAFQQAVLGLDPRGLADALNSALAGLGLDATIDGVLLPAMRQVGRDWEAGRCDPAHEHLATETIRAWLSQITSDRRLAHRQHQPILLACGPNDHHTLGLESVGALLRERGRDCRILGARTPAASLATAIEEVSPAAVVVVSHLAVARRSAVAALRLAQLSNAHVFYAGNAFLSRQARRGVPGSYLGDDLSYAADIITTTVTDSSGSRPRRSQD